MCHRLGAQVHSPHAIKLIVMLLISAATGVPASSATSSTSRSSSTDSTLSCSRCTAGSTPANLNPNPNPNPDPNTNPSPNPNPHFHPNPHPHQVRRLGGAARPQVRADHPILGRLARDYRLVQAALAAGIPREARHVGLRHRQGLAGEDRRAERQDDEEAALREQQLF